LPSGTQILVDVGVVEVELLVDVAVEILEEYSVEADADLVDIDTVLMVAVEMVADVLVTDAEEELLLTGVVLQVVTALVSKVTAACSAINDPTLDTPVVAVMAVLAKTTPINIVPVPNVAELPT
jgi:hypothetical protein